MTQVRGLWHCRNKTRYNRKEPRPKGTENLFKSQSYWSFQEQMITAQRICLSKSYTGHCDSVSNAFLTQKSVRYNQFCDRAEVRAMVGDSVAWAIRLQIGQRTACCRVAFCSACYWDVKGLLRASSHLIFSVALNCAEPILFGHYENLSHRQCFSGVFKDYQSQFNLILQGVLSKQIYPHSLTEHTSLRGRELGKPVTAMGAGRARGPLSEKAASGET